MDLSQFNRVTSHEHILESVHKEAILVEDLQLFLQSQEPAKPLEYDSDPTTLVIKVPKNVNFQLGGVIQVQGFDVPCLAISWIENEVSRAFALEERLDAALDLLENGSPMEKDLDGYKARLTELFESGELTKHAIDSKIGFKPDEQS